MVVLPSTLIRMPHLGRTNGWAVPYVALALLALLVRLLPVLNGGGLSGIGNYDDTVYFGSALALVHGQLPYRDFLLLHPPGRRC